MARKDITMSPEEVDAFLRSRHTLQVATHGPDGFPHLAPMWFFLDAGRVGFRSFTKSQKIVNLQRNPKLTILAEAGLAYSELQGVMIKGEAELVTERGRVLAMYAALASRYPMVGDAPVDLPPDALEAAFGRYAEKNTGVIVHPVKVVSWDHSKLGGAY